MNARDYFAASPCVVSVDINGDGVLTTAQPSATPIHVAQAACELLRILGDLPDGDAPEIVVEWARDSLRRYLAIPKEGGLAEDIADLPEWAKEDR